MIAESVGDLATHLQHLADPDSYRPQHCSGCGHGVLHVHDYRWRVCQLPDVLSVCVVRYRCVGCEARWQVLPAFIPRHLWFHWPSVEAACEVPDSEPFRPSPSPIPPMARAPSRDTVARWIGRLLSCGRVLAQVLASSAERRLVAVAQKLGLEPIRREVVAGLERPLAEVAALAHRLVPGVRLM
ncbi:hypothetical protein JYT22_00160 [Endomicrobium sp. AH-315-J14]|nr:hypothetical protein [Endomicrobium sp. AH-315-J14]